MKTQYQVFFWLAVVVFLALFLVIFRSILTPFVAGIVVAYLLNPLVARLERLNLSRLLATIAILVIFFCAVIVLLMFIVPPLYRELVALADRIPTYIDALWERMQPIIGSFSDGADLESLNQDLKQVLRDNVSNALNVGANVVAALIGGGRAFAGFLSVLVITPLVSFFMMVEWKNIVRWVDELLPRKHHDQIADLVKQIDKKISGFIRGQLMVAITLGIIYAIALTIAGLEFGFLIGLASGALTIVPLLGSIVGLLVASVVAWLQSADLIFTGGIMAIFLVGQLIESNFITPKFLSGSVGLHPLWILFSILAGSALFGVVGMMVAVPVAATIGVLLTFAINNYKSSQYYDA